MKKISIIVLTITFLLSACSDKVVIKNESFVDSLEQLNKELINNSQDIDGELNINISAGFIYKSSKIEIGLNSNSDNNSAYYDLSLSAETLVYLFNSITKRENDNSSTFSPITIYTDEDQKNLTKGGNKSDSILTFKASALNKFYKGNELYLSNDHNKAALGNNLDDYQISSQTQKVGNQTKYVTTLVLSVDQLTSIIPFVNFEDKNYDGQVEIKFYQDSRDSLITSVDIVLYNYTFTAENNMTYVDVNVAISLDLPVGGKDNE